MTGVVYWLGAFEALARRRPVLCLLVATVAVSLVVVIFPGLDLAASRAFYVPGEGFPAAQSVLLKALRAFEQDASKLAVVLVLVSLIVPLVFRRLPFLLPQQAALFLATTMLIGPGLIVNAAAEGALGPGSTARGDGVRRDASFLACLGDGPILQHELLVRLRRGVGVDLVYGVRTDRAGGVAVSGWRWRRWSSRLRDR